VLEEHKVVRLGSTRAVDAPARVIAATHRELAEEVAAGRFRQDLLFRLDVHTLRVPPLRDRLSDLPELTDHLLAAICERFGIALKRMSSAALEMLSAYDWGRNNVRELRNVVERMVIASDETTIGVEHVPDEIAGSGASPVQADQPLTYVERKAEAERQIVAAALKRNDGHVTRAAEELGLADHASLLKIMRRLGIKSS
jgi:two-component system response regulator HydG